MAKYLLLIFGDDRQWEAMTPGEMRAHDAAHAAFRTTAGPRLTGGRELEPVGLATSVRADEEGRIAITDGPFLETKEALGGFYEVQAADLDEVLALAALLPEVRAGHSGVEIRPVVDHG
jgi:hypothetical protein